MLGQSRQENRSKAASVILEREGERRIRHLLEAVDQVPWTINLLQLAWTAGPVTFLAANGGYYIGFGEFLPWDRTIFFIGYTVLAGIAALLTKILYDSTHGRRKKQQQESLTSVLDRLPELIFSVRNLSLARLTPEARKREAARLLLERRELEPDELAMAVEDLTDSARLADTARRIETYRHAGMYLRAEDLLLAATPQLRLVLDELYSSAPATATLLRNRLEGRGPSLKQGIPREQNFIERIFAAIEEENDALMTLRDVEEVLTLAFELISGREIPMLVFNYRGRWTLARATDALERARMDYRIAQATGYSRLKALTVFLAENRDVAAEESENAGHTTSVLLEAVRNGIGELCSTVKGLRRRVLGGQLSAIPELQARTAVLATALDLYRAAQGAYKRVSDRHAALVRARRRWEAMTSEQHVSPLALRIEQWRRGLRIAERSIRLDDDAKLQVADALCEPLQNLDLRRRGKREAQGGMEKLTMDSARRLAIEVALVLERHIHISAPEIQRAINSTNAPHFGAIEPGMSAATKAAIGAAVVKDVRTDLAKAAEHLASALVRHYRVELTEPAIRFLHETYQANPDTLKVLAQFSDQLPAASASRLQTGPPSVPGFDDRWQRELHRARRLIERRW